MSGKKRTRCIDYDSEGRIILLPLQIPAEFREPRPVASRRENPLPVPNHSSIGKKANHNSGGVAVKEPKIRKLDHNVRKELFKVPTSSKVSNKSKLNLRAPSGENSQDTKISKPKNSNRVVKKVEIKNENETPTKDLHNMSYDSAEFVALEKSFQTPRPKRGHLPSPLVVYDLENTNLSVQKTSAGNKLSDQVKELRKLIEDGNGQLRDIEERMVSYKQNQSLIHAKFSELLDAVDPQSDETENKENDSGRKTLRRSQRLHPEENSATIPTVTLSPAPAGSKDVDLRKTTLRKNLLSDVQNLTPRTQKAEFLYKSIRTNLTLATPTYRNVKEQYLLLQCTPRANKTQM